MKRSWADKSRYVRGSNWTEGKSWHDTIWLMVPILAILLSGPLWFFRLVDLNMSSLTWSLFAFSLIRELTNSWLDADKNESTLLALTIAGDTFGICLLGVAWHFSQTVGNPLFLLVLLVPIIAGALVYSSTITFALAALSILTVFVVAWLDIPQLRSTLLQSTLIPGFVASLLGHSGNSATDVLTDYSAASALSVILAFSFGCVIFASIADRLCMHFTTVLQLSSKELASLSEDRRPMLSINRDTLSIISANRAFREYCIAGSPQPAAASLLEGPGDLAEPGNGPQLFECIQFDEEAEVRRMIAGRGGSTVCHYHVGPETRIGRVHAQIVRNGEQCELALEDLSAELYLRTTLDTLENGVILLGENRTILFFNQAARRLFPLLSNGIEAASALKLEALGTPWWDLGDRSRHNRILLIGGRKYYTVCSATQLPGQADRIFVASLSEA